MNAPPRIVLVTDPAFDDARIVDVAARVADVLGSALLVQLRDRVRAPSDVARLGERLRAITSRASAALVVNGDAALARALGADGVHLGGAVAAERVAAARAALAPSASASAPRPWISVAAHDDADVASARVALADAALVSPIFATPKYGAPAAAAAAARGVGAIVRARAIAPAPFALYALGGVDVARAAACAAAGATGVAVVRALLGAADPAADARAIAAQFAPSVLLGPRNGRLRADMDTYEHTLSVTTEILAHHVDTGRTIRPNDHIQNDLGLDSLGVMEVVADIEDRFDVTIPTDTLAGLATVEDVARALLKLKA